VNEIYPRSKVESYIQRLYLLMLHMYIYFKIFFSTCIEVEYLRIICICKHVLYHISLVNIITHENKQGLMGSNGLIIL